MRVDFGDGSGMDLTGEEEAAVLAVAAERGCTPADALEYLLELGQSEWERRPLRLVAGSVGEHWAKVHPGG